MEYKNELLAYAYRKAKSVLAKIKELGITPDLSEDAIEKLVIQLSKAKAALDSSDWKKHLKGQEWYVSDLVKKSAMTNKELLDVEYQELLPANSSFDELVNMMGAE